MYEVALLTAFTAALVACFFGRQVLLRPNRTDIMLMLFGTNVVIRHVVLYIWLNLESTSSLSSILRAMDYVIGVPIMLMGLELFRTSAIARVKSVSKMAKPLTYLIPIIVLPMFTILYYVIDLETARRLAVIILLPALGGMLSYYIVLFRKNPYKIAKPEYERGMALILVGYLVLVFGAGILTGMFRATDLAITAELIAVLMVGAGGIVAGTVTFAGLYSRLNARIMVVNKDGGIELAKIERAIELHGSKSHEMRTASAILPYIDSALEAVFSNGIEIVLPYVTIDSLNPNRVYQVDVIPHQLDSESRPISALVIINDVTDSLKEMETEQLSDLLSRLVNERDAAKFYLDLLSHDIRNHLQAITMAAEIVGHYDLDPELSPVLELISESIDNSRSVILKVQGTRGLLEEPLQDCLLTDALNEAIANMRSIYGGAAIEVENDTGKAFVKADGFLESLLTNIIENAINHNPSRDVHVWVEVSEDENTYTVSISDNGPGIPDERKKSLFDPERRFGGVGIHQALKIVKKYGGLLTVHDRIIDSPEEGARFDIVLPKAQLKKRESESDIKTEGKSLA